MPVAPHLQTKVLVYGSEIESVVCAKIFQQNGFKTTLMFSDHQTNKDKITVLPICLNRLLQKIYPDLYVERICPASFEIHQLLKQDHQGNPWGVLDYTALEKEYGHSHQVLLYDTLWQILYQDYLRGNHGGFIDGKIESIQHQKTKDLTEVLVTHKGKDQKMRLDNYDFVIGADGSLSKVRDLLWKEHEITSEFAVRRFYTTVREQL